MPPKLPQPSAAELPQASAAEIPAADWSALASDHFASSVAPKSEGHGWGSIIALGILGAAGMLGAGYALHLVHVPIPTLRPSAALIAPVRGLARPQLLAATFKPTIPSAIEEPASDNASAPHITTLPIQQLTAALASASEPALAAPNESPIGAHAARPKHKSHASETADALEPKAAEASEPAPEDDADLPAQPSREQIKQTMEAARSSLQLCSADAHGIAFANVTIAGSGHVSYSTIGGAFAGTPQGSCMARALRSAQFPRFAATSLTVSYPFQF
jgi:hypothetical protein